MSQRRLIISLALISSCLALVIALAAWTFPLKAQGVTGGVAGGVTPGVSNGVAGGVSNGIAGGISGGVSGGVPGGISTRPSADEPSVDISTIWTDTVKRGAMPLQVRGKGTLDHGEGSANLVARVTVPASISGDVKLGESASVVLISKNGVGKGHVSSIGPEAGSASSAALAMETRTVDITLDAAPQGAAAGLEVWASIDVGKLDNVLFVGRPVNGAANSSINLFKISSGGSEAIRTQVKLGRASANTIEILDGLQEGDKVILSDMSTVANAERVRLTDEKHLANH